MRQIEATGKTIEKAIESGLKELDTTLENVDIQILNEGGLLKKAKVLITLSEDETNKVEAKVEAPKVEEKEDVEEMVHYCDNGVCRMVTKEEYEKLEANKVNEVEKETNEEVEVQKTKKETASIEEVLKVCDEFINGLCYNLNLEATITHDLSAKLPMVKVKGDDLGVLIGYRGDAMEAIQNLMNNIVSNKLNYRGKVILDVEGYRERRIQTLCDLATRISKQVLKNKKSFKLEPMNSYERRIIHTHLQNIEHISTHSEGKEPERYLIIDYVE